MFDRWEGDRPVGRDDPEAWTQIAAVSQDQTKNTLKLFPALIPQETRNRYGIQIGKLNVWSDGDRRQIEGDHDEPLTRSRVVGRTRSFALRRRTGLPRTAATTWLARWRATRRRRRLVLRRGSWTSSTPIGLVAIRLLSVRVRRGSRRRVTTQRIVEYGVLWDSLEAPPDAPLTKEAAPEVVRCIAGDAMWLDTRPNGRILKSILNPENSRQ